MLPFALLFFVSLLSLPLTPTAAVNLCDLKDFLPLTSFAMNQGGKGVISLFQHKTTSKYYIQKIIPKQVTPGRDEKSRWQAFINEATILEHLQNSDLAPKLFCTSDFTNITLPEYTKKAGTVYIMMEFIEGQTLEEFVSKYLDADTLRHVLKKVADRIYQLHSENIIHIDIKLENIMVDRFGDVKLIDFGGSFSSPLQLTTGYIHMSEHYYPFALVDSGQVAPALDWYSFGATAYFARQYQLNLDKDIEDLAPVEISKLPDSESDLKELIQLCMENVDMGESFQELYERIIQLPYFREDF